MGIAQVVGGDGETMLKSVWKSLDEIEASLAGKQKIAVISCGVCANLSGTGGAKGLKTMRGLAKKMGKDVLFTQCVIACCSHEVMTQAKSMYLDPVAKKCDALVMLSCAGGVKSAYLTRPGVPVVAALDSVGSAVITNDSDLVATSLCSGCGQCVLTFTGGICPVSKCPSKRHYSPCKRSPVDGTECAVDPSKECIWKEIEKRGNLAALEELGRIHKQENKEEIAPYEPPAFPGFVRALAGWTVARNGRFAWLINSII